MYWYVLFVRTGQEYIAEKFLKERLNASIFMPFIPIQRSLYKKCSIVKTELKPLFPGYVFIETDISDEEFVREVYIIINSNKAILRLLKYSDSEYALKESEKQALLSLCDKNYNIDVSHGIIEGDEVHIIDGPLVGMESIIKKINRHKRQAFIEIEFMGELRSVNISLEILSRL